MPLNGEERYEFEKYKQRRKRMTYSEDEIDKMINQRNQIIRAIRKVVTEKEFSDGSFKDEILRIMEWRR